MVELIMGKQKMIDTHCIKCMRYICIEDGSYRYCSECMPKVKGYHLDKITMDDLCIDPATKPDRSAVNEWLTSFSYLEPEKMSAIPKKSLFRFAVVKSIRNADLVIVNQELIRDGVILAVNENDARVRVGQTITITDADDVEVTVVSF